MSPPPRPKHPSLSIVVPCSNEEAVIRKTHERLMKFMDRETSCRFEVLYIDDGSRDGTFALLQGFQAAEPRVRVLALSRNFGHQVAVSAGLEHAAGHAVVVMDADLQDPPEVIPRMLELWRDGVDVAYGMRRKRHGESVFKRWSAGLFYRLMATLSDTSISLDTGDFCLMDRRVVNAFLAMPERDRFIRGMVAWTGFRQEPVMYERQARVAGETSYTMKKMVSLAICGIFSFSIVPLRVATWVGLMASGLSLVGIVYALVVRLFTEEWVRGWALLLIGVMFLGGVQLTVLGIFGEYLGRIYREVKGRPLYLVRERLGFPAHKTTSGK